MDFITLDYLIILGATGIMGKVFNALSVMLGLGLVIFFHELGHFAVAKWCGVHVERFSIGIGPIIWSRQKGETEYALSALPFGGYVKMLGQDDMDPNQMTSDEIAENPRSYSAKKVWQRMLIISAGVVMNVITGFMFFAIAFRFGVIDMKPVVGAVNSGAPAWEAGILPDDRILSINGDEILNFSEIQHAVVLSSGDISITVQHPDGTEFQTVIAPKRGKTVRSIGVEPGLSLKIRDELPDGETILLRGLPAWSVSPTFQPGDRVTTVNGEPVTTVAQLTRLSAKYASEDLKYTVERQSSSKTTDEDQISSTVEIVVPPQKMRSLGLWMAIGPVKSIRTGSIAESAGLKVNDKITQVDDLVVGIDIDPLRLPNYFADHAGSVVKVTVERSGDSGGEKNEVLEITPDDQPGWSEIPRSLTAPLPIPAIGAAYHVQPRIKKVIEGSEASATSEQKAFAENQKIVKVQLEHPDPKNITADALGDATQPTFVIDLENPKSDSEEPEEVNWAAVFYQIQSVPDRNVHIFVGDGPAGGKGFSRTLKQKVAEEDWYLPIRGIRYWEPQTELRKADSWGQAISMGVRHTRNSAINICLTLRSLFRGDLSPRSLSGPVGIVNIGYKVADQGTTDLILFLGFLSINLAVLNFLPIPVLDGGHMVFLIWEGVTRRKPSPKVIGWAHAAGLMFIILLFVFVLYLDIFVNLLGFGE